MWPTLKATQRLGVVGSINPKSASTAQTSGWISAKDFLNYLVILNVGTIVASGTVDLSIAQAQDSSGTGSKAMTGKAITQLTQAGANSNSQCLLNLKQDDFDVTNNFCFFQVTLTPAVAAALIDVIILGIDAVQGFGYQKNQAQVAQVIF